MAAITEWSDLLRSYPNFRDIPIAVFAGKDQWADSYMRLNYSKIKINQIRNFFEEIKEIKRHPQKLENEDERKDAIALLEMNLAYDFGRNVISKDFYQLIIQSLKKIYNKDDFERFDIFVQALIAYHKFYSESE